MQLGKMRHRVVFQAPCISLDDYGAPLEDNWLDVVKLWAAIEPISGREFYAAQQSQSEVSHKVRIRYHKGLNTAMRIRFGERVFSIISIINWEERNAEMLLMCKELVS